MQPHHQPLCETGPQSPAAEPFRFILKCRHFNLTDEELLNDLKLVAANGPEDTLSSKKYERCGRFSVTTVVQRFGSWNKALQKAGLTVGCFRKFGNYELFENMETVWRQLGRQPQYREMSKPLSRFSGACYAERFKSWTNALKAFVAFTQTRNPQNTPATNQAIAVLPVKEPVIKHKTKREPAERLKVQVLMRDGNRCRLCGKKLNDKNIHFDHIVPWSLGGETVLENLQVLCKKHNYAKGNLGPP